MDYLLQQKKNARNTYLLVFLFLFLMATLGLIVDALFGVFPFGTIVLIFIALIQILTGVASGPALVLRSVNARRTSEKSLEERQLKNIVEELTIAAGLEKAPEVYVMEDENINAFATGFKVEKSAICVTSGLLKHLNREETEGVIAHELSHIKNKDTLLMTTISAILGTMVLVQLFAWRSLRVLAWTGGGRSSRKKDSGLGYILVALLILALVATLFSLIGRISIFAVSRTREYLADAGAVELTRNPKGLANALRKIAKMQKVKGKVKNATIATAHLFISDPLRRSVNEREGFFANLFSTHPPIHKRIALLENVPEEIVLKELQQS
ncbi:MAG: Protease HtpX-like protein [Thermotoga sp. 50_1627]|uniref:M48 family metallopeptidase n=1 Tax=Pseudothermotoga sp. TaxID=2033661 RepID=UPI00076C63FE|nr:MAG: Protease HtpX-like protein [Thermotoga sp. 50_64]KUK25847.1 MAG: Protease HtpX-like protein [Thermotoga sp. 50_1627]MBC7116170.1 M48 family metallopeptidase [Pseudothermotoga sp.]